VARGAGQLEASAHGRMERLLRQTGRAGGLALEWAQCSASSRPARRELGLDRLRVADMEQPAGRPICTALRLLLSQPRLLSLPRSQRLAALSEDSRKFQNEVSERLAQQVLHALYELLRGFQAAHDASGGKLLREPLGEHPDEVYRALLTVLLRLVFLLYAEEREMLPEDETFLRTTRWPASTSGCARTPRSPGHHGPALRRLGSAPCPLPDDLRRADCGTTRLPKRHGVLFDPDRFKFLEGRSAVGVRQVGEGIEPPLVPDGTIYRASRSSSSSTASGSRTARSTWSRSARSTRR